MYLRVILTLTLCWLLTGCRQTAQQTQPASFVKGVYGNPSSLWREGYRFDSLGINAVFVRSISLNRAFVQRAQEEGARIFVEFPTLNGKEYLKQQPEAAPITEQGIPATPADWFMGICPTDPAFKQYRKTELAAILDSFSVDGVFLDYFHWHAQFESDQPILPETCFCERCIGLFGTSLKQTVPGRDTKERAAWILKNQNAAWRKWRSEQLTGWLVDLRKQIKEKNERLLVGVYHCGWFPDDHDSALYRILGIDLPTLAKQADVLSPMLFHKMKNRSTAWVGDYLHWMGAQPWIKSTDAPLIWPIVQAHDKPDIVSPEEFSEVLRKGAQFPSSGIMPFSAESIAGDTAKIGVLRSLYLGKQLKKQE